MADYKIIIRNAFTQEEMPSCEYSEKSSAEAKALAYVHGRNACAKFPDGEYTCQLLVKLFVFSGYKEERCMPMFAFKVTQGVAKLSVEKQLFGGETATLQVVKNYMLTNAQFLAKCLMESPNNVHIHFSKITSELMNALSVLHVTYNPEYFDEKIYSNIKSQIQREIDEESTAYTDFTNGKCDQSLYQSKVNKSNTGISSILGSVFMQKIMYI